MNINERIKEVRKALDLTQLEFGNRIGIKRNSVALIENGRNTSDQTLFAICREFHVNEEWLRNGSGEMFVKDSEDELKVLTEKYSLTSADRVLIEKYVSLNADTRKAILKFMTDVVSSLEEADRYSDIPYTPEELEQNFLQSEDENKKRGRG